MPLSLSSTHDASMNENSSNQAHRRASLDKSKTTKMTQYGYRYIPKPNACGPDLKPPFLVLAKDFDTDTKDFPAYPPSFDLPERSGPYEALSKRGDEQKHSGHSELDRPWASERHIQLAHTSDSLAIDRDFNKTPLSSWSFTPMIDEPYHAIGSVMHDHAARPAQASSSTTKTRGSTDREQKKWGSSGKPR